MIYDVFSRLFLAVLVVAYLGFLAALAWWALRGRLRLKDRLVPAFSSGLEGFRASLAKAGRRDPGARKKSRTTSALRGTVGSRTRSALCAFREEKISRF